MTRRSLLQIHYFDIFHFFKSLLRLTTKVKQLSCKKVPNFIVFLLKHHLACLIFVCGDIFGRLHCGEIFGNLSQISIIFRK